MFRERDGRSWLRRSRLAIENLVLFGVGCATPHLIWIVGYHYRAGLRMHKAVEFHKSWWDGGPHPEHWRRDNLIQFALWFGIPLAVLAIAELARRLSTNERRDGVTGWTLGCFALMAYATLFAKSEVMRLWLFWMPLLIVAPASWLARFSGPKSRILPAVLVAQFAFTFALQSQFDP
jgi:hypothetical protein